MNFYSYMFILLLLYCFLLLLLSSSICHFNALSLNRALIILARGKEIDPIVVYPSQSLLLNAVAGTGRVAFKISRTIVGTTAPIYRFN